MLGAALLSIAIATQEWGVPYAPKIDVDLLASHKAVMPGDRFAVLVRMDISEPWHVYWKNPGDSGIPTRVQWELPKGWIASELEFPAPHRLVAGELISYGFEKQLMMVSWISVPADAKVGSLVKLGAKVNWLACIEQCVQGDATVETILQVGRSPQSNPEGMTALQEYRHQSPRVPDQGFLKAYPRADGFSLVINESNVQSPFFFAESYEAVSPGAEQVATERDGKVELSLVKSPYSGEQVRRLKGVLTYIDGAGKHQAFAVNIPVSNNTRDGEKR